MGLAVYNSIILDIRFPPCCYKKLLSPAVVPFHDPHATVGLAALGLQDLIEAMPVRCSSPPSCALYFWLSLFCASEKKRLLPARAQSMISFPRQRLIRTGSFLGCVFWEYSTMKSLDMRVIFISNFLSSCYCHNRFTGSGARTQGIAGVWWWC